ncbi:cytoskeletal protein binding protein [Aspergillus hancockii]|nr:cytoskeletal protein binding protein [Aspergillus hancockii]
MGFLGVYTALYDYQPQAQGELELREGDLLCLLEKSEEDSWWKAKKKAEREDEDEPEGLVPNNYIEEVRLLPEAFCGAIQSRYVALWESPGLPVFNQKWAQPIHPAKALFDYTRQTDEEVSFTEDAELLVYDTSDPDWILVGVNGDFGFAPANYIEITEETAHATATPPIPSPPPVEPAPPSLPQRPAAVPAEEEPSSPVSSSPNVVQNPAAAAIANIIHKQHAEPETTRAVPPQPQYEPEPSYQREPSPPPPALPQRPPSQQLSPRLEPPQSPSLPPRPPQVAATREETRKPHVKESPPYNRVGPAPRSPSGYHIYNVNEMVEVMGKRKKKPTTLGINVATGTIFISPEDDGEEQEWTADKLSHYSIEGKHVFVDLIRPSKSIDFHAGAKDTAREIVAALGEISGAYRAEGLREVIAAGSGGGGGQKKGQILYDFVAQQDDEVGVNTGDEVIILDNTKSEEWWMVRRVKNGKEGVVPSSYVEVTGYVSSSQPSTVDSGLSAVERNRLEESRLAKEALRKSRTDSIDSRSADLQKRDSRSSHKSKPDPAKTRQWTDRTKTFTVEAQFIGLQDGKIHLHKTNGVKIAVPIPKMSLLDLEYVEKLTGVSLDEDKPLSDIKRRSIQRLEPEKPRPSADNKRGEAGASFQQSDYDWFDFFLKAGVGPHQCERYAQNFVKDSMDENVLPDITPEVLRTLGLKEGDILRVMRHLDTMFNRTGAKSKLRNVSFGGEEVISNGEDGGGLFAGPGGVLRNNTRKGRPAPAVQTGDVVDPKAFEQKDDSQPTEPKESSPTSAPAEKPAQRGFDDDAWEVKQPKQTAPTPAPAPAAAAAATPSSPPATASPVATQPPQQQLTGALADLSILHPPLQPAAAPTSAPQPLAAPQAPPVIQPQPNAVPAPAPQQPQQTGATPSFFSQLGQAAQTPLQNNAQGFSPQVTGFQQASRQRPQPPQAMGQSSLLPPPPPRPLSAPQNFPQQQSSFSLPPLQPQLTGLPQAGPPMAPPGQSLAELNRQRFQQPLQPQTTAFMPQNQFQPGLVPQPTGFQPQSQFGIQQQQQQQTGFQGLAPQPTGFGGFQSQPQQPMQTGINSVLPQPLQPQPTGMNGIGGMPYTTTSPPPIPQIPQQPAATPLAPQKTGPAPSIRFGVKPDAPKKLAPQPTGLRANLAQATPTNPFGF